MDYVLLFPWIIAKYIFLENFQKSYFQVILYHVCKYKTSSYQVYVSNMYISFVYQVTNFDFPALEGLVKTIVKENQPFERLEVKKEHLLEMFKVFW